MQIHKYENFVKENRKFSCFQLLKNYKFENIRIIPNNYFCFFTILIIKKYSSKIELEKFISKKINEFLNEKEFVEEINLNLMFMNDSNIKTLEELNISLIMIINNVFLSNDIDKTNILDIIYNYFEKNHTFIVFNLFLRVCLYYQINLIDLWKNKNIINEEIYKNISKNGFELYEILENAIEDFNINFKDNIFMEIWLNLISIILEINLKFSFLDNQTNEIVDKYIKCDINEIKKTEMLIIILNETSLIFEEFSLINEINKKNFKNLDNNIIKICDFCHYDLGINFYTNEICNHSFCINCLTKFYNKYKNNFEKSFLNLKLNCFEKTKKCEQSINLISLQNFLIENEICKSQKIEEILTIKSECLSCFKIQEIIINSSNSNPEYLNCINCQKMTCLKHKCPMEICLCSCIKCYGKITNSINKTIDFSKCLKCKAIFCNFCKQYLINENDNCKCRCIICKRKFELFDNFKNEKKCYECKNSCDECLLSFELIYLHSCQKCSVTFCNFCFYKKIKNNFNESLLNNFVKHKCI